MEKYVLLTPGFGDHFFFLTYENKKQLSLVK